MAYLNIGEFQLDVERARIINKEQTLTIEPKVLDVLLVLMEKPGQVVSKAEIIDKVWGEVVVEPNALHRCIRQLRKAFNDSVKEQSYIATHPKKGYSLVAKVTAESEKQTDESTAVTKQAPLSSTKTTSLTYFFIATLSLIVLAFYYFQLNAPQQYLFTKLTPLTATDAVESNSVFSPDGKKIIFLRENSQGDDNIWWLELDTKKEHRLTAEAGLYRNLAWSPNGQRVAFTKVATNQGRRCMQVESLFLPTAKTSPQLGSPLIQCDAHHYESPQWLNNKLLFVVRHRQDQRDVVLLDSESGEVKQVFFQGGENVHALAMSHVTNKLAITILNDQQAPKIVIYHVDKQSFDTMALDIPAKYSSFEHWHPTWNHHGNGFVFSVGRYLLHMDLKGIFTELHSSVSPDLRLADMSPLGNNIVMTMGKADRDIYLRTISESEQTMPVVVGRSPVKEYAAKFNPQFNEIAFLSEKSGTTNVWLEQANGIKQLSNSSGGVEQFVWSESGQSLMLFYNGKLEIVSTRHDNATPSIINTPLSIKRIFQWYGESQLLCSILKDGKHQLISLNIENGEIQTLYNGYVYWAQIAQDKLITANAQGQLFVIENSHSRPLVLETKLAAQTPFFIAQQHIYFQSDNNRIWQYNLNSTTLTHLTNLSGKYPWFNDISPSANKILTSEIRTKQTELVILHH